MGGGGCHMVLSEKLRHVDFSAQEAHITYFCQIYTLGGPSPS